MCIESLLQARNQRQLKRTMQLNCKSLYGVEVRCCNVVLIAHLSANTFADTILAVSIKYFSLARAARRIHGRFLAGSRTNPGQTHCKLSGVKNPEILKTSLSQELRVKQNSFDFLYIHDENHISWETVLVREIIFLNFDYLFSNKKCYSRFFIFQNLNLCSICSFC